MNKQVTIDVIFLQLQTVSYIIKVHFSYQHFLNCTQVSTSFWTSFVLVRSFGILLCRKLFKKVSFTHLQLAFTKVYSLGQLFQVTLQLG